MRKTSAALIAEYAARGLVYEPRLPTGIAIHTEYKNSLRVFSLRNCWSMSKVVERLILDQCARMCAHWDTKRELLRLPSPELKPGRRESACLAMTRDTYAKLRAMADAHGWMVSATLEALIYDEHRREREFLERTGGRKRL